MDSKDTLIMEMEQITISPDTEKVDLASLELNQRQLVAELKMKKNQVEQLREKEDKQNMKIHELQLNLDAANAKISEIEFELNITKTTCASYNAQLKNVAIFQQKTHNEKLIFENQTLKELLQKSELEQRKLVRKLEDLTALDEMHNSNKNAFFPQEKKYKETIEKIFTAFKEVEKESSKTKSIHEKLQQIKEQQQYIDVYKKLAQDAIKERNEMEGKYITVKTKLDVLTDLLDEYPLPQVTSDNNNEFYKKQIEELQKALNEEKALTIRQNAKLATEIAQNVALCLKIDSMEKDNGSKCMKDMCLQTDN